MSDSKSMKFNPVPFSPYLDLRHCDCMDYMRGLPDKAFSLAIVDPPYGINAPNMSATPCQRDRGLTRLNCGAGKLKDRVLNQSNCEWDNHIPDEKYFIELFRVTENQIIWGMNYFVLPATRGVICWDKVQPWENFSQIELAWTSFDYPAKLFIYDNRTGGKIHPTQKPVALYRWLLATYTKPGDTILDTHMGSGSIAIACHYAGYRLAACEIDADYYRDALERVERETRQQALFPPTAAPDQEHGLELL